MRETNGWTMLAAIGSSLALGWALTLSTVDRAGAEQPYQQVRTQEVVEAKKFVLRDESGLIRAELGPNAAGTAIGLRLYDRRGRVRANLAAGDDDDLIVLSLIDGTGKDRVSLISGEEGATVAVGGRHTAGFYDTPEGQTVFVVGDDRADAVVLGVDAQGRVLRKP